MRLVFSRQNYFIFGFVLGTLSGLGLNFVFAQSYELDEQAYFEKTGQYEQVIDDKGTGFAINTYEAICKGYQVVYKNADGSETAIGYGALADEYSYEKTAPTVVSSSTPKSR